eukprot:12945-Pelagococcus_subviridis.AAC.3
MAAFAAIGSTSSASVDRFPNRMSRVRSFKSLASSFANIAASSAPFARRVHASAHAVADSFSFTAEASSTSNATIRASAALPFTTSVLHRLLSFTTVSTWSSSDSLPDSLPSSSFAPRGVRGSSSQSSVS